MAVLSDIVIRHLRPLRYTRKITDGGGLYLLLLPTGGKCWRYNYRFEKKRKTVALGTYPDISLAKARARHREARCQVAQGIDPAIEKRALGRRAFEPHSDK